MNKSVKIIKDIRIVGIFVCVMIIAFCLILTMVFNFDNTSIVVFVSVLLGVLLSGSIFAIVSGMLSKVIVNENGINVKNGMKRQIYSWLELRDVAIKVIYGKTTLCKFTFFSETDSFSIDNQIMIIDYFLYFCSNEQLKHKLEKLKMF